MSKPSVGLLGRWRLGLPVLLVGLSCVFGSGGAVSAASAIGQARRPAAPRAIVLEAQTLFHVLGYPLPNNTPAVLEVNLVGALRYFQRKYGLPVTGYPDEATLALMRSAAASLRSVPAKGAAPHDLVERVLGDNTPIFPIALALALLLTGLALVPGWTMAHNSRSTDDIHVELEEA